MKANDFYRYYQHYNHHNDCDVTSCMVLMFMVSQAGSAFLCRSSCGLQMPIEQAMLVTAPLLRSSFLAISLTLTSLAYNSPSCCLSSLVHRRPICVSARGKASWLKPVLKVEYYSVSKLMDILRIPWPCRSREKQTGKKPWE